MKRYEYDRRFGFVMLVIDEGDEVPSAVDLALATELEDAIKSGDPNVEIVPGDRYAGCALVSWAEPERKERVTV